MLYKNMQYGAKTITFKKRVVKLGDELVMK